MLLLSYREQMNEKSKVIQDLVRQHREVQEVPFDTMLKIVQACNDVNPEPPSRHVRKLKNKGSSLSVLQGIAPGKNPKSYNS